MKANLSEVVSEEVPAKRSEDIKSVDIVDDETVYVAEDEEFSRVVGIFSELRWGKLEEGLQDISHPGRSKGPWVREKFVQNGTYVVIPLLMAIEEADNMRP